MKVNSRNKVLLLIGVLAIVALAALLGAGLSARAQAQEAENVQIEAVADETDAAEPAAESAQESDPASGKALAAGIAIGVAAAAGAIGMGIAIAKTNESIARQPEADGKMRSTLMLGLIFIETAIIYALVVAILIIFAV